MEIRSRAARGRSRVRRGHHLWMLEGLEGRVLLSGNPTTYTVNATTDTGMGSGLKGDLRYCIDQANANTNTAGSLIQFDPTVFPSNTNEPSLITLSSGLELSEMDGPEVIEGPEPNSGTAPDLVGAAKAVVIGDNNTIVVFTVDAGVMATLSNLLITPAYNPFGNSFESDMGGICNASGATLTVTNCNVEANGGPSIAGGDILNSGTMTITGSFISGLQPVGAETNPSEGGIDNNGTMTVAGSTIESNEGNGDTGGGILNNNGGSLKVIDSTIAGNQAQFGGGIWNAGTATVINSTIAANLAGLVNLGGNGGGGGIASAANSLTLVNSTVADNFTEGLSGGGLYIEGGTATLDNTIVASNTNQNGPNAPDDPNDIAGTVSPDSAYNLIGTGGSGGLTGGGTSHNQVGVADPGLYCCGPDLQRLANNGGPTQTVSLLLGSPAIGAGNVNLAIDPTTGQPLAYDQRGKGFPRSADGIVDIGAYELGYPKPFMVESFTSTGTGTGNAGDLVYCIEQANANPDPAGSVIQFDPTAFATPQTITLTNPLELFNASGPEEIDGPGASLLTIHGHDVGPFQVDNGVTANISGLTISGSFAGYGGGIENDGTLTVTDCTIANNEADGDGGGIQNESDGTLTITNSTITGNSGGDGGGIDNYGTLTITNSTITGNSGSEGGGIFNKEGGTATVTGSTIENNSAAAGGGIESEGPLTIVNSTIAANLGTDPNNYLGAGIDENGGTLTAVNCTIASNDGGGLYVEGGSPTTLDNTIVALNTDGTGIGAPADDIAGSGSVSGSNNLIGTGGSGGLTNSSNNNQVGVADPGLDPNGLQWNGGPTQTIALMTGSLAIGAGSDTLAVDANGNRLTTDQRGLGFSRFVKTVDVGAFEAGNPTGYLVNLTSDTGAGSDGAGDLLYCITQANANTNPQGSLIEFDPTVFTTAKPQTINLSATLELTETAGPEVLGGPGAGVVTISGNNAVGVFDVPEGVTATLSGLTISGGMNSQAGGAIYNDGTLTVTNSTLTNNTSGADGGAIADPGMLTITNSTIENNSAPFGGGIDNEGTLTVTGSTIQSNTANKSGGFGGGIDNDDGGMATLISTTVAMNSAVHHGGGVFNAGGSTLTFASSTLSGNTAASGGGIESETSTVTVTDSTLSGNDATGTSSNAGGGGVYNSGGTASITGSTLSGNSASNGGGGIYASSGALTITASTLSGNSVTDPFGTGGGIDENAGTLTVTNSTIADNSAQHVGAGIHENNGTLTAVNCTIAYNTEPSAGDGFGGGMDITKGTATLYNTIIALNTDGTGAVAPADNIYLDGSGTVSSASANNLLATGGNSGVTSGGSNDNQVGVADPGLDTGLANNGGLTQTIALLSNSPAVDAGNSLLDGGQMTDQRGPGFPRIFGKSVDIGAFELQTAATTNPAPSLSTILPDRIVAGYASPITLTLSGSGFISGSVVDWNSTALATTYVSPNEVTATIPSSDFASVGTAAITVTNPPPGGGTSTGATFQILAAPTTVYISPTYAGLPLGSPVTWTDGSTHSFGYDAFGKVATGVAAVAALGTVDFLITNSDCDVRPDTDNTFLVVYLANGDFGEVTPGDTIGFSGSGGSVAIHGEPLVPDVFTIKDTSVQFDAADDLHGMTIEFDGSGLSRNVVAEGTTNTFDIEGAGGNGPSGRLSGYGNNNEFVFGPTAKVLGSIAGGPEGTLDYSAYSTGVTVNLGNALDLYDNSTNGTATGVSGSVADITTVIGSNFDDTLNAGVVLFATLTGGLGTNSLSGTGNGDSVVESIASSYTLSDTNLTGSGASFSDNLSGIRVATLTGSGVLGNAFTVSGWTGSGSLTVRSGFASVTAIKNANFTLTNATLVAGDGMSLKLSGINIAGLTVSASAGKPTDLIDASAFSGAAELSATGTVNAILYGDSDGYDTLAAAGSGNDILIGYAGHVTLTDSGSGRNILIGAGAGGDTFTGKGNDILVSGTTNDDSDTIANIAALDAILAEWTSKASYANRIQTITKGVGKRHVDAFNARTIRTDTNPNTLSDKNTRLQVSNWFLVSKRDSVTKNRKETKTII
ncbi:MAG: beta strand repeat-containing protein [Isosphaerales bacterium]